MVTNISKCENCACSPVCKFKELYAKGVETVEKASIPTGKTENGYGMWMVKDCPHIEVSIKCPHIISNAYDIISNAYARVLNSEDACSSHTVLQ